MPVKFICYPKCATCKRAKRWLDLNGIQFETVDIKINNPSYDEIKQWVTKSGIPVRKFFNYNGVLYKKMGLKDKLPVMNDEEQLRLLASNGMLIKRPLLVGTNLVLVGFKSSEWKHML